MANPYDYRGSGTGFLDDYSNINAAGAAFKAFAEAADHAQDQKQKRLEQAAQLEATRTKMDREKFQSQIEAAKEGYKQGTDGELQETQLSPKIQGQNSLKAFGEGAKATGFDENGNPTGYAADESSPKMLQVRATAGLQRERLGLQERRFGEQQDQNAQKAGKAINEDSVLKDMETARYSLSRGKSLLDGKQPLTYNNLNAVQQDIISGMTKGGQSSEGKVSREMQESWTGRWNNLLAKAGQYGADNDIRKQDPGLYKQIQGLLNEVDSTIAKNSSDRAKKLGVSYSNTSNQKVKKVVGSTVGQYATPEASPQGLVPQGLVQAGKVGGGQAPAGGQDPQIAKYAQQNGIDYAPAAVILKNRGYNGQP